MTTFASRSPATDVAGESQTTSSLPPVPITVARGDGIGPEIMAATLRILEAAGARLDIDEVEIG